MEESQQQILTQGLGSPVASGAHSALREDWPDEIELIDMEQWLARLIIEGELHDTARKLLNFAWRRVPGRPPIPPLDLTAKRIARRLARSRARELKAQARAIRQQREAARLRGDVYGAIHALNGSHVL